MKTARVVAFIGALIVATWLVLLAIVLAAEYVTRNFTGPMRSIVGLAVFTVFLALAVTFTELLRRKILPKIIPL